MPTETLHGRPRSEPHRSKQSRPAAYSDFDRMPIGGAWRPGRSDSILADYNPYTGDLLLECAQANPEDLDEAYTAAAAAQREWAERLPSERAGVMRRAADVMVARREEIVGWLIREAGSTRFKAGLEWAAVHAVMQESAAAPYRVEGRILPSDVRGKECRVYRKPVGVVAVVSPWNWPLQLTARSLAPALAVGNGVVVKPASDTPVTGGLLLARIFEEAGLPPGLLSVIVASGKEIGDAMVCHPVPRVVSFTGSTPVGRHILELASQAPIIKRVELELGGNGPFVVLPDADMEQAVEAAVFGKFLHQGQICMTANRFIVVEPCYEEFAQRFAERVRLLKVGDPDDEETMIGPMINRRQLDRLGEHIDKARRAGVRELVGGEPEGLVMPPHVFADVRNEMEVARQELFGPVAPLIRATGEEEALRIANDTEHGLSGSVFTRDVERGARFAQRMHIGMAHVNDQPVNDLPNNPFGGEKNSGIGRFGGRWAVDAFTTDQWLTIQHSPRPLPTRGAAGNVSVGG